jgi:DNA polymerase elongation subunit (family B)
MNKNLIYGKDATENIVSIEVVGDHLEVFTETNGVVECHVKEYDGQFMVFHKPLSDKMLELDGDLFYKYIINYKDLGKLKEVKQTCYKKRREFFTVAEPKENSMLQSGMTYFNGMEPKQVSILSFDLETTSLTHSDESKILIISNTFRNNKGKGNTIRKLFCHDDYDCEGDMIVAWCDWVTSVDPSIICGHNIYGYDFPYLRYCAERAGVDLCLGRDLSSIKFNPRLSKKRKDGSQEYEYTNCWIYGREIVDTFFLAITYDIGRKYPSYGLKPIIEFEGLEVKGRQHYDASTIRHNYKNEEEWVKIKKYAEHDADDSLALFDLMIPSFFHYTKSIPKPFQQIINTATGSQVNSVMIRGYLQDGHSLPKSSEAEHFEGAISFGNPGMYKRVYKVDVASLYPSIMRHFKVCDVAKDPKGLFLELIETFTVERLKNKEQFKETGERIYSDLSDSQKIFINSGYGFLGAQGLLFNSPENASFVTRKGRMILTKGLDWCKAKGYPVVNADTDSFSYVGPTGYNKESFKDDIDDLNKLFPELIVWEDDGTYKKVIVVKTKNYILDDGKKIIIKGSSLKATMKEPILKQMIKDIIKHLLNDAPYILPAIYDRYVGMVEEIETGVDMANWASKKTVTESVLKGTETTARKMRAAIGTKHVQEGDKLHVFFKEDESLCLLENFNGDFSRNKLYEKIYKTLCIFDTLFSMDMICDFSKKTKDKKMEAYFNEVY